jgi:hypothetical protein
MREFLPNAFPPGHLYSIPSIPFRLIERVIRGCYQHVGRTAPCEGCRRDARAIDLGGD